MEKKSCIHCGNDKDFDVQYGTPDREGIPTHIICGGCGATGPQVYIRDRSQTYRAWNAWNKRVGEPPQ